MEAILIWLVTLQTSLFAGLTDYSTCSALTVAVVLTKVIGQATSDVILHKWHVQMHKWKRKETSQENNVEKMSVHNNAVNN